MHPHRQPILNLNALTRMTGDPDEISDEEANAEIEIPGTAPSPSRPGAAPTDDTTPSVRQAIDKAADVLRELRRQQ